MPPPGDYAEKKIAEYLARVSTSLQDLPEDERTRLLRNVESDIRTQLRKRNPGTATQWDVDVVLTMTLTGPNGTPECILNTPITEDSPCNWHILNGTNALCLSCGAMVTSQHCWGIGDVAET